MNESSGSAMGCSWIHRSRRAVHSGYTGINAMHQCEIPTRIKSRGHFGASTLGLAPEVSPVLEHLSEANAQGVDIKVRDKNDTIIAVAVLSRFWKVGGYYRQPNREGLCDRKDSVRHSRERNQGVNHLVHFPHRKYRWEGNYSRIGGDRFHQCAGFRFPAKLMENRCSPVSHPLPLPVRAIAPNNDQAAVDQIRAGPKRLHNLDNAFGGLHPSDE